MATVDPLEARREELESLKNEQENLRVEWADKRFDGITRSRFNELEESIREAEAFIGEKEKVASLLERHAQDPNHLERSVPFQTARPGSARGDEIWDLSTIQRSWDNPQAEERQFHDRAMSAIERSRFPHPDAKREPVQEHLERLIGDGEDGDRKGAAVAQYILATGSPVYRSAFSRYLAGAPLSEADQGLLFRAASLTTTSGGFAVPFVLDPTVIPTSSGAINPYRSVANVSTITVDEWRGVSSDGITAAFQAEAAATTDNTPTLAQPTVTTEMGRAFVPFSIEIGQDWGSFQSEMSTMLQDSKDVLEATKFAVGSGTNEPFGVVTGATTVFTASNTNSLVVADIYGVHNALGPRFRSRASWTTRNEVADKIRQLDTSGGANMWVDNLQLRSAAEAATMQDGRMGAGLLGKPVYEATGQSGTFTTGQLIAVFGDFNYYKIAERIGLTIEVIPHLFGAAQGNLPTGQRGLFAYWRVGAKVLHANAFRTLKLG